MACQSCAAKAAARNAMVAPRKMKVPVIESVECVYTLEQIEEKIQELLQIKSDISSSRAVRINSGYKIFKLKKALNEYEVNCNKYLRDLQTIIG